MTTVFKHGSLTPDIRDIRVRQTETTDSNLKACKDMLQCHVLAPPKKGPTDSFLEAHRTGW